VAIPDACLESARHAAFADVKRDCRHDLVVDGRARIALKGALFRSSSAFHQRMFMSRLDRGSGCYGTNGSDDAAGRRRVAVAGSREARARAMVARRRARPGSRKASRWPSTSPVVSTQRAHRRWDYAVWTPTHSSRPKRATRRRRRELCIAGQLVGATPTSRGSLGGERNARHTYSDPEYARRRACCSSRRRCACRPSADSARRRTVSPTSRSWTSWRSQPARIRLNFVCDTPQRSARDRGSASRLHGLEDGGKGMGAGRPRC
jgi:hypothetical protein